MKIKHCLLISGREGLGVGRLVEVASLEAGPEEEIESDRGVVLGKSPGRKPEKRPGAGQEAVTKPGPGADLEERTKSSPRVYPGNVPRRKRPKSPQTSLKTKMDLRVHKQMVLQLKAKATPLRGTKSKFQQSCKRDMCIF